MKTLIRSAFASLLVAGVASAASITGSIKIVSYNDPSFNVNYATNQVTFGAGNNALVSGATGSYTGLLGASVHYNNFGYDPLSVINPLWATTSQAPAAYFTLTSISFVEETPGASLTLKGWGLVTVAGFQDTIGSWSFTSTQEQNVFGWDSINTQPVPDGGATLALLGASVLGLGGIRRFLPRK